MPFSKQHCPKSAACWSPAIPAIGISIPLNKSAAVFPYTSLEAQTFGKIEAGIPNSLNNFSSHSKL